MALMGCSLVVALLVGTAGLAAARSVLDGHKASIASAPKAPVWPDAYEVAYTIELPYIASVQPTPLRYPVHVWYDGRSQLLRTSFYEGLDETYLTPDATYEVYPRVTTRTCLVYNHTVGPTLRGSNDILAPLPDIGPDWQYGGSFQVKSHATHMWQLTYRVDEKVSTYTFHVAQADGRPLQLHMVGVNLLTGSHYDQYEVDFTLFEPRANAASFAPPSLCKQHDEDPQAPPHHAVLQQAASLLLSAWVPAGVSGRITPQQLQQQQEGSGLLGALHGLWSRVVGATSETASTVLDNLRFIHEWNRARAERVRAEAQSVSLVSAAGQQHRLGSPAGGAGAQPGRPASPVAAVDLFKMEANKFVSWGEDKFASTMLGRAPRSEDYKQRRRSLSSSAHLGQYQRRLRDEELPQSVDWRGSPADGPVKDQASCGSCWTFATTGAMRGQWFTATGQALSFSEQQIVDCSWNYEVNGCWGGDTEPAMEYIRDAGGAVLEADYPYLGQNSYCKDTKHRKAARFSGYQSIPKHDEKALMEAVHLHGPLSIAFDAGDRSFRYYSEGVYYRESCGTKVRDLNHAVTLVGYGTTWNGTDYWLLRNSWSVAWGSDGYFKLARKGNDCGVTTDAVLAVVDEDAAAQARRIAAAAA